MELVRESGHKIYGGQKRKMAIFKCEFCKKEFEVRRDRGIKQVACSSCRAKPRETHGMSGTKQYNVWQQMIQRCQNPNHKKFHIYGGKGIQVSKAWETFEGFWADMREEYKEGLTIDRKNSSLGYDVNNCRWIPHGRNSSETTKRRPVTQMTKRFEPIKEWESAKYAADELKLVPAHITSVCQGNRQTHGGFRWEYTITT